MKFTANTTTSATRSNFKVSQQSNCWWIMQRSSKQNSKFFVHFSPNSASQTCFLPNHTWSPIFCHTPPLNFVHSRSIFFMVSHTINNKSSPGVSSKILRIASTATSEYSVMPWMRTEQFYSHPVLSKRFQIVLSRFWFDKVNSSHHCCTRQIYSIKMFLFGINLLQVVLQIFPYELPNGKTFAFFS